MEAQTQPIVIQQGGSKMGVGGAIFGIAVIGAAAYFGNRWWKQHVADKEAEKLDTPEAQAASKIFNAKNWYGDKEEVAYEAAREIAQKNLKWADVAKSFKAAGHGNIDEYLDFLSPEEKAKFFNILNLSKGEPGKSPPGAQNPFDTTKNISYAFLSGQGHIRKTPEIKGTSWAYRPIMKDNIVVEAKYMRPGMMLGFLTGKTKTYIGSKSDQGTLFYEFATAVTGLGARNMWVAAQFVKVFEYKTKEVAKLALEKEMKSKNTFHPSKALYEAATA